MLVVLVLKVVTLLLVKLGTVLVYYTLSTVVMDTLTTSLSSYTLYIYIDGAMGDNPSSMMNQSFDFSFVVDRYWFYA